MALSPRQDGGTHHRRQNGHWRLHRRRVPANHALPAHLSRSLGDSHGVLMRPDDLYSSPNALAGAYARFRVADRLLLTGHSHQAWPDCSFEAQQQSWYHAAALVDDKWETALARAEE